ncbi:MAG: hypothetical protein K2X66_17480 [Cyanobacteria bacterium]|nr:hypothetical protein [Cyanobacteriota bacterium]
MIQPTPQQPPKRPKILLLGHGRLGQALLEGLVRTQQVDIIAVFPWSLKSNVKHFPDPDDTRFLKQVRALNIPTISCKGANSFEFIQEVESRRPDYLLIGSWGEILKSHVLRLEGCQVINCHPSLLPAHRGANPYVSCIRSGDQVSGVSFHLVDENIDTGPLILQQAIPLSFEETGGSLRDKCAYTAGLLAEELVQLLVSGEPLTAIAQNEAMQSYYPPLKMEDGYIYWEYPPEILYNQVRGMQPWLDCYTFLEGKFFLTLSKLLIRITQEASHQEDKEPQDRDFQQDVIPGQIQVIEQGIVWVHSAQPGIQLGIAQYKLYFFFFFLPTWLSKIGGAMLFKPGKVFRNPTQ